MAAEEAEAGNRALSIFERQRHRHAGDYLFFGPFENSRKPMDAYGIQKTATGTDNLKRCCGKYRRKLDAETFRKNYINDAYAGSIEEKLTEWFGEPEKEDSRYIFHIHGRILNHHLADGAEKKRRITLKRQRQRQCKYMAHAGGIIRPQMAGNSG